MISPLRIAFLGTYHPAVPTLRALVNRGWVAVVVLPEEAGAKNDELLAIAREHGLPCTYRVADVDAHQPNFLLAANYPKLVPARLLEAMPCVNTHWSLLPRWRGVHGTAWALLNGDERVGLTVHLMAGEFDTGPILAQASVAVTSDLSLDALHSRLAEFQATAVVEVLERYQRTGELPATAQDESEATYVPQRVPADGVIDWTWPTARLAALVRVLPAPKYSGAFTWLDGRRLVIRAAQPAACPAYYSTPGQVVRVCRDGAVWIKTGDTCLAVTEVAFSDDDPSRPAREVLKRGVRLGRDLLAEVDALRAELRALRSEVAAVRHSQEVIA